MQNAGKVPSFVSRQCLVVTVLGLAAVFMALSLAFSWYRITEERVPYPAWTSNSTATVVSTFYWTGVFITVSNRTAAPSPAPSAPSPSPSSAAAPSASASPSPAAATNGTFAARSAGGVNEQQTTTIGADGKEHTKMAWSEFPTGALEMKMLTSMALMLAALGLDVVLVGIVAFGRGPLTGKFGYGTMKWILFGVSLAVVFCSFLAWFLFFGICESFALDESYCPDEAYLGHSVFDEEKYWCTTFLGHRDNIGAYRTNFKWGPLRWRTSRSPIP